MSEPDGIPVPRPLREKARRWEEAWGLPGLLNSVTVEFSTRMRVSLGLCRPVQGRIRLTAHLANGRRDLLEEVLCHELAHARRSTFFPTDGSYWGSDVPTGAFRADGWQVWAPPIGEGRSERLELPSVMNVTDLADDGKNLYVAGHKRLSVLRIPLDSLPFAGEVRRR